MSGTSEGFVLVGNGDEHAVLGGLMEDDLGDKGGDLVAEDTKDPGSDRVSSAAELVTELVTDVAAVAVDDDEADEDFSLRA